MNLARALIVLVSAMLASHTASAEWRGPPIDSGVRTEVPSGADIKVSFDYGLKYGRKWWMSGFKRWSPTHHNGIDFVRKRTPTRGSEVLSASIGTVVRAKTDKCAGGWVVVRTPFKIARSKSRKSKAVYVEYAHLGKIRVKKGQRVKHGTPLGDIGPAGRPCVGKYAHLHFAVTHSVSDTQREPINPNKFWANGPGKLTCFRKSDKVPTNKLVLTSPIPCELSKEFTDKIATLRPEFEGNIHELGSILEKADKDTIKKWQAYFKLFGHYKGAIDGVFGKNTKIAAVRCAWDTRCNK